MHTVPLGQQNLADLTSLCRRVFKKRVDETYLASKYDTAYGGVESAALLAYDDAGEAISFFGAIPFRMGYGDTTVLAAQSADGMTDARYSRRGWFTRLARLGHEQLRQRGIAFIYGFPNRNSYAALTKRMAWVHAGHMRGYMLRVPAIPVGRVSRLHPITGRWYDARVSRVLAGLAGARADLPNSALVEGHAGSRRDEKFFQYKRFARNRVVLVNGCQVWLKVSSGILIGDIESRDEETLTAVVRGLRRLAVRLGQCRISFQCSPGLALESFLAERYTGFESWPVCYRDFSCPFPLARLRFNYGDLDGF